MTSRTGLSAIAMSVMLALIAQGNLAAAQGQPDKPAGAKAAARGTIERGTVDRIIAAWGARPRLGAVQILEKYGEPQEASGMKLVWHNAGPFKRIAVMNLETPHDFPLPHVDYMEHTIFYDVPQDKLADLLVFDGSSTINRTTGELSARCDLEAHNILTLNLDHDIVTGKKSVAEARKAFGDIVQEEMMGKRPAYTTALQFKPAAMGKAMFSDEPMIPGSPLRAADAKGSKSGDAEVLGMVAIVNRNEITAAMEAQQKKLSKPVMDYAKMLHQQHGMNMGETLKVGQQANATPVITPKADELSKKGAQALGILVPKDGEEFERGYLDAMVKGHTEVLSMIDNELMGAASNAAVKAHLTKTRASVADHLAKAKSLQK